jgi:adenine deaminase
MQIEANLVDLKQQKIYPAQITIKENKIQKITPIKQECDTYILPGFIDAHIHIESSMLPPSSFAKLAIQHGTVATVSDPHEIANVLGIKGVEYMIANAQETPFKIYFGASPCVPATPFETSGATLTPKEIEKLLQNDAIYYLSEVMNFPGVINDDPDMLAKIALAKKANKPIDGHAPNLRGDDLQKYIDAGVQTDHEAFSYEEAKEKLQRGMKIQIREGSAAKNYEALHPLIDDFYENLMFCSDDRHPNDLVKEHINSLVKRAIKDGHDLFKVLQIASVNPIKHYNLDVGMLQEGDNADFIIVQDLQNFTILRTFINGECLFEHGKTNLPVSTIETPNNFHTTPKEPKDFLLKQTCQEYRVIQAFDGQLITKEIHKTDRTLQQEDTLFISVVNRYADTPPTVALIQGFGLKEGAIASSVAHDSHNIVAVGRDPQSLAKAVNTIIASKGGICAINTNGKIEHLPLDIAGLMSTQDGLTVAKQYETIDKFTKEQLGSTLQAPFMTLSFMALLVIPELKLSDKGLFDANSFHFTQECII